MPVDLLSPALKFCCRQLVFALALMLLLVGCGGLESSSSSDTGIDVNGAGVKGPLINAGVAAYLLDPARADLKGQLIALGLTDGAAQLDLQIPTEHTQSGPFLLEYSGGTEINGSTPAIAVLTTLLTNQQLASGTAVYATPLSSLVLAHARLLADQAGQSGDPLFANLAGDNNGSVSTPEFLAAVQTSANLVKNSLGLGLLGAELNLFTTSPLLDGTFSATDTLALRTANEVFAALVTEVAAEIANGGLQLDGATILTALANDFSDGIFDGLHDGTPIAELAAVPDIAATLEQNPVQLLIPGTLTPIADIANMMIGEATMLELAGTSAPMPPLELGAVIISVYEPAAATGDPEPSPEPEPEPEPEPVNAAPTVSFAAPQANALFNAGDSVTVALSATDSDGSLTHCDLSINGSFVRRASNAPYTYNDAALNNLAAGGYTLAATCVDDGGLASSAQRNFSVAPAPQPEPEPEPVNNAPSVTFTSPSNGATLQAGASLTVSLNANDSDGNVAFCDVSINGNFVARDSSAPFLFSGAALNNLAPGSYTVLASCSDNLGLSGSAQTSVSVAAAPEPPNQAPTASFSAPANNQIFSAGEAIYVNIDAQDSDGSVQSCSLTLNGNTIRSESVAPYEWGVAPTRTDAQFVDLGAGDYTLVGSCIDDDNTSTSVQRNFSVAPTPEIPPQVSFVAPASNTVYTAGESAVVEIAASDSDGSIAYCDVFLNGELVARDSSAPYQYDQGALTNLSEGSYTVLASCTDNADLNTTVQLAFVVNPATDPVLADVLLDWVVPTTREDGSTLAATDIESYEIYYYSGSNSSAGTSINVAAMDGGGNLVTSYQLTGLASGNYFFSIATIDTEGNVSEFVEPVPLSIQ